MQSSRNDSTLYVSLNSSTTNVELDTTGSPLTLLPNSSKTPPHTSSRHMHPALFSKAMEKNDGQQTIRGPRQTVSSRNDGAVTTLDSGVLSSGRHGESVNSDLTPQRSRSDKDHKYSRRSSDSSYTTPNRTGSVRSKSSAKRARMNVRRSNGMLGSDDSSSDDLDRQDRRFEEAFRKFDPNNEGHISTSDFLQFFDTLQGSLPPLSDPLLDAQSRHQTLEFMAKTDGQVAISRGELKTVYKEITGRSLMQEANERVPDQPVLTKNQEHTVMDENARRRKWDDKQVDRGIRRDQLASVSPTSPSTQTVKRMGDFFARPRPPRKATGSVTSASTSDDEGGVARSMADILNVSSIEFTGDPLASSTPTQKVRRVNRRRGMSPDLQSPSKNNPDPNELSVYPNGPDFVQDNHFRHPSTSADGDWGYLSQPGSPTSARSGIDENIVYLQKEQELRSILEQEISALQAKSDHKQRIHDEELLAANEEVERLNSEVETKRKELERLRDAADRAEAEVNIFSGELQTTKEERDRLDRKNMIDREQISNLNSEVARLTQQKIEADHRINALTADLRKVIGDRDVALAEKESIQKKANLVADMGRQVKSLKEQMKDRDVEIERLKTECERRQMDLEAMTNNLELPNVPNNKGGRGDKNRINQKVALLSDELTEADDNESEAEDEEDDEEEDEEIVTTVKRTTRKKKKTTTVQAGSSTMLNLTDEVIEGITSIVETSDRAIQTMVQISDIVLLTDIKPPLQLEDLATQTVVAVDTSHSLEDHYQKSLSVEANLEDRELLEQIAKAKAKSLSGDFASPDLEELFSQIGLQSELIQKFQQWVQTKSSSNARSPDHISENIDYTCYWINKWIELKYTTLLCLFPWVSMKQHSLLKFYEARFYAHLPLPSPSSFFLLALLIFFFFMMACVTFRYASAINRNENIWRKVNKVSVEPLTRCFFPGPLGMRSFEYLKYEMTRRFAGSRKMPI